MTPVVVRLGAEADIEDAFRWYEEQRAGFGEEFRAALRVAFDEIAKSPLWSRVLHRNTRREGLAGRLPICAHLKETCEVIMQHAKPDPWGPAGRMVVIGAIMPALARAPPLLRQT